VKVGGEFWISFPKEGSMKKSIPPKGAWRREKGGPGTQKEPTGISAKASFAKKKSPSPEGKNNPETVFFLRGKNRRNEDQSGGETRFP